MNILKNKSSVNTLLLVTIVSFLSACSDGSDDRDDIIQADPLTVASYNVGLALNFVPYTNERLPVNAALLADYDSDVLCLQEVWLEEYVETIEQALIDDYPYIYTVEAEQIFTDEAPCTDEDIADFAACLDAQCPDLAGADFVGCASTQCFTELTELPGACFDAVVGSTGVPNIDLEILVDRVTQPTGIFAYDGALGLMLASKHELQQREFQDFIEDSTANHRGALYAEIEVNEQSHVVGCAHPTANLEASAPYPESGKHGSWEGENRFMQEQMISFVNNKAGDRPILFGGDFNCSIANASNGVDAEFPDNCQLWLDDGFVDPAAEQLPCTFCNDENLILQEGSGTDNTLLDHVFVKNVGTADSIVADRVFDDPVSIEALDPPSELQPEDSPMMTHPSDHFGVELNIRLP